MTSRDVTWPRPHPKGARAGPDGDTPVTSGSSKHTMGVSELTILCSSGSVKFMRGVPLGDGRGLSPLT